MKTNCPHCDQEYEVPNGYSGKNAECEVCDNEFIITETIDFNDNPNNKEEGINFITGYPETLKSDVGDKFTRINKGDTLFVSDIDYDNFSFKYSLANGQEGTILLYASDKIDFMHQLIEKFDNPEIKYQLGNAYLVGQDVEMDDKLGVEYLQQAVNQGHIIALGVLGTCYLNGWGVTKDLAKAVELFQKGVEENETLCIYHLANAYRYGMGIKPDLKKAYQIYELSAKNGYPLAKEGLAGMLLQEQKPQNTNRAIQLLQEAIEEGKEFSMSVPVAYYLLGHCYLNGNGVVKNRKEAKRLLQISANEGFQPAVDLLEDL